MLGAPYDHAMPIFVHGPPVTGKSSIVRDVFASLGRPFAYTSLVDSHGPRLLLDAIIEELAPYLRGLTEKQMRCDRLADLVAILSKGLPPDGPAVYLVIDEATRLLDWKGAEPLLPALMKLSELTGESLCASGGIRGGEIRHKAPFLFSLFFLKKRPAKPKKRKRKGTFYDNTLPLVIRDETLTAVPPPTLPLFTFSFTRRRTQRGRYPGVDPRLGRLSLSRRRSPAGACFF